MYVEPYSKDNIDNIEELQFHTYKKKHLTQAARIDGPFECITVDGNLAKCEDGYLGIDSLGYPYPIAREDFENVYEQAEELE